MRAPYRVAIATFNGRCELCRKAIRPGFYVVMVAGEYCHASCAEEEGLDVEQGYEGEER